MAALRTALEQPDSAANRSEVRRLLLALAALDPELALNFTGQLEDALWREELRLAVLRQWADVAPTAALTHLETLALPEQAGALEAVFGQWVKRDISEVMDWLGQNDQNSEIGSMAREALVNAFQGQDLQSVLDRVQQRDPDGSRYDIYTPLFRQWIGTDPAAAVTAAMSLPTGSQQTELVGLMTSTWASQDTASAVSFMKQLPGGPASEMALSLISFQWIQQDPQAAITYALEQEQSTLLAGMATIWAGKDPQRAAAWTATLPAGEKRNDALGVVMRTWTQTSPLEAATFAAGLADVETQALMVAPVVTAWTSKEPGQAAEWVTRFPEGPLREQAYASLVESWVGRDPLEASEWLNGQVAGASRDAGIVAFTEAIAAQNLEVAYQWAATIGDGSKRVQRMEAIARMAQ